MKNKLYNQLVQQIRYGVKISLFEVLIFHKTPVRTPTLQALLIETLVWRFFFKYASTSNGSINRYFFFLLFSKKSYKIDFGRASFFTYNYAAINLLKTTVAHFSQFFNPSARILFIVDSKTEIDFGLKKLNLLFWPKYLAPLIFQMSRFDYYYGRHGAYDFELIPEIHNGCNLIVFCGYAYERLNVTRFSQLGCVTAGICSSDIRPDLFNYSIPVTVSYQFTVGWIVALVLLNHSLQQTF